MHTLPRIVGQMSRPMQPLATEVSPRLDSLTAIRAVVFDIYGTLLISASGDVGTIAAAPQDAFAEACQQVGLDEISKLSGGSAALVNAIRESHERARSHGIEYPEVDIVAVWQATLEDLVAASGVTVDLQHVDLHRLAVEYEVRVNPVWPMAGIEPCLAALRDAGTVLGIVSNAQFFTALTFPALLNRSLPELGFRDELCVWSFQHGQAKPGEFLYRQAAKLLARQGIDVGEVLYIGNDLLNDVTPAHRVGFRTGLFAGDRRSLRLREDDERVAGIEPDLVITHLDQIPGVLGIRTG